jgi:site-specific recombinase XerD
MRVYAVAGTAATRHRVLETDMLEVLAPPRRRSYITLPGYRAGMPAPNAGRSFPAEVLTREEVTRLLGACSRRGNAGLRHRALIVLLYRSGLRIGEALALRPKDIDLDAGTVTVLHGKGDHRRTVGVDGQALAVVQLWLQRRRELGIGAAAPVFCTITKPHPGKQMHSSVVREAFKDLAVKAGIDKRVHPHGLRHTHASELAREGVPLHVIRRQLGHADLATTARYIDHLTPWEVIDAIRNRENWADHE